MKKNLDKFVALFAVIVFVISAFWITRSCNHKTVESGGFIYLDSLKEERKASAERSSDSVKKYDHEYQDNLHKFSNPDSIGRELFRARLKQAVSDSLRKRALR